MAQERIPAIRGLVDVGLSVGAIVTQESVKGAWQLTAAVARFAGRQTMQNLQRFVDVTDAHSHALTQARQQEIGNDTSRDEARDNFILALVRHPKNTPLIEQHFAVLDAKIQGIAEVSDGIRMKEGPDGIVSSDTITKSFLTPNYVEQVEALATELDVNGEAATSWVERLRTYSGEEMVEDIPVPEMYSFDKVSRTRESTTVTL